MTECGEGTCFDAELPAHQTLLAAKPQSCGLPVFGLHYKVYKLLKTKNVNKGIN